MALLLLMLPPHQVGTAALAVCVKTTASIKHLWFATRRKPLHVRDTNPIYTANDSESSETQQRRTPTAPATTVSRGQGLHCLVFCVLGECVCVWCPTRPLRCVAGAREIRLGLVHNPGFGEGGPLADSSGIAPRAP